MSNHPNRSTVPDAVLERIAAQHFRTETLETRRSDSLDFREVSVWSIKAALADAYRAGRDAARERKRAPE